MKLKYKSLNPNKVKLINLDVGGTAVLDLRTYTDAQDDWPEGIAFSWEKGKPYIGTYGRDTQVYGEPREYIQVFMVAPHYKRVKKGELEFWEPTDLWRAHAAEFRGNNFFLNMYDYPDITKVVKKLQKEPYNPRPNYI